MTATVCAFAIFLVIAVPISLLMFFRFSPKPWRETLQDYQSFVGSIITLLAAGLALLGVLITLSAQEVNTGRQFAQQRAMEDRGRAIRRQQIASAFIAEINVIAARFQNPGFRDTVTRALERLKNAQLKDASSVTFAVNAPTADYAVFFRTNSAEVGILPDPLPHNLLLFYGIYLTLEDNIKFLADAYVDNFKHLDSATLTRLLEGQVTALDSLQGTSAVIIPQLQKIVDERIQ
jgi:hypothetical protein